MALPEDWRRYVAPAAFLLAVTVAVVLIHSGVESGHSHPSTSAPPLVTTSPPPTTTAATTTTTQTTTAAVKRYWVVKAGDTFGVISAQSGVPVATIEQLNPTIKSTSLFIGEKIRIR